MKKIYLLLSLMLTASCLFAQVSVTATSGTTGPVVYTTIKTAFDAVNAGTHKGVITITVNGSTTETASAVLNSSGTGSSSYTGLSIKPSGSAGITGNLTDPLIDFNGADNITIDGLNSGNNSLTISNTGTTAAATIRFINDATNNTIQNTSILGTGSSAASGNIYFSTGVTTGNDNNTIANCIIADAAGAFPVNGIYSAGNATAGQENSGITIFNNSISNFYNSDLATAGVLVSAGNTDWTISGNKFFQTAAKTFTTGNIHRGIQIAGGNNYNITGNTIGYSSVAAAGTYVLTGTAATRFIGIDIAAGSTVASSIQNNTVAGFSLTTSSPVNTASGIWCAINVTAGDVNVGTVTGNTIGSITTTGSIVVSSSVAGTYVVPVNSSSTGNIFIANNKLGGIDFLPTGVLSGNIQCIQTTGASGNISITNNVIGNAIPNNIRIGVLGTTTGNGSLRGIFNTNAGNVSIASNTITNLTHNSNNSVAIFRAIECQMGSLNITGNVISNISAFGTSTSAATAAGTGIQVTSANPGISIDQNTIFNLNVTNPGTSGTVVTGIYAGSSVNGISITRNKIYGFTNASTSVSTTTPGTMDGIYLRNLDITNPVTVANNMISLGNSQSTNTAIIGIWSASNTSNFTERIYYNSVNIEGAASAGAQPSFCFYRGDFSASFTNPSVDLKNNIFTNTRSGGTGKHYAIANSYGNAASTATGWISDYNVLNAAPATVGYWSGDQTFAGWQNASAGDAHSLSGIAVNYLNSATDLHLLTFSNNAVDGKATPLALVTNDIDGDLRNAATPDLGADEFTATVLAISTEYFKGYRQANVNVLNWKTNCSSASVTFQVERSTDAAKFVPLGSLQATKLRCETPFDFTDNNPLTGINYYRLKMTGSDGKIDYSTIIAIINKERGFEIVSLLPSVVYSSTAVLNVTAAQKITVQMVVTDMQGRIIQKQTATADAGSNTISINFSHLPAGSYQLTAYTSDGVSKTIQFIKQ